MWPFVCAVLLAPSIECHTILLPVLPNMLVFLTGSICYSFNIRYEATLHPAFLKKTKYTFDASVLDDEGHFRNGKHELAECLCKSPNLHIVGLDENFNAK